MRIVFPFKVIFLLLFTLPLLCSSDPAAGGADSELGAPAIVVAPAPPIVMAPSGNSFLEGLVWKTDETDGADEINALMLKYYSLITSVGILTHIKGEEAERLLRESINKISFTLAHIEKILYPQTTVTLEEEKYNLEELLQREFINAFDGEPSIGKDYLLSINPCNLLELRRLLHLAGEAGRQARADVSEAKRVAHGKLVLYRRPSFRVSPDVWDIIDYDGFGGFYIENLSLSAFAYGPNRMKTREGDEKMNKLFSRALILRNHLISQIAFNQSEILYERPFVLMDINLLEGFIEGVEHVRFGQIPPFGDLVFKINTNFFIAAEKKNHFEELFKICVNSSEDDLIDFTLEELYKDFLDKKQDDLFRYEDLHGHRALLCAYEVLSKRKNPGESIDRMSSYPPGVERPVLRLKVPEDESVSVEKVIKQQVGTGVRPSARELLKKRYLKRKGAGLFKVEKEPKVSPEAEEAARRNEEALLAEEEEEEDKSKKTKSGKKKKKSGKKKKNTQSKAPELSAKPALASALEKKSVQQSADLPTVSDLPVCLVASVCSDAVVLNPKKKTKSGIKKKNTQSKDPELSAKAAHTTTFEKKPAQQAAALDLSDCLVAPVCLDSAPLIFEAKTLSCLEELERMPAFQPSDSLSGLRGETDVTYSAPVVGVPAAVAPVAVAPVAVARTEPKRYDEKWFENLELFNRLCEQFPLPDRRSRDLKQIAEDLDLSSHTTDRDLGPGPQVRDKQAEIKKMTILLGINCIEGIHHLKNSFARGFFDESVFLPDASIDSWKDVINDYVDRYSQPAYAKDIKIKILEIKQAEELSFLDRCTIFPCPIRRQIAFQLGKLRRFALK